MNINHEVVDYLNPDFRTDDRCYNWKNYVTEELESIWMTFTSEQKKAIAHTLNVIAQDEDWDEW